MNEEYLKKLFQKYLDNNCTPTEKKYLDELFDSYIEDTVYNDSNDLENERSLGFELFEKVRGKIKTTENPQENKSTKKQKNTTVIWTVAASIAILLGVGISWVSSKSNAPVENNTSVKIDLVSRSTIAGEKKEVRLRDGSIVYLNSESKLSYNENFGEDGTRWVKLEGEAFFEVAPDKSKPFIIESGTIVTEVKGTSFNIQAFTENNDIAITVLTGEVGVSKKGMKNKIQLVPNTQALFSKENDQISILEVDAQQFINWKNGILNFEDAQMEDVLNAIERWYGVNIVTENLSLNDCSLTAKFNRSSIYEVMESIKFAKENIEYTIENNTIELKGFCNE